MENLYNTYMRGIVLVIEILAEKFDFFEISKSSIPLRELIEKKGSPGLVFDLSRVKIIDSSVFGFLIEMRSNIKKNGNDVVLVCSDPYVLHIMTMMKVQDMMKVVPDLDDAFDTI